MKDTIWETCVYFTKNPMNSKSFVLPNILPVSPRILMNRIDILVQTSNYASGLLDDHFKCFQKNTMIGAVRSRSCTQLGLMFQIR